MSLVVPLQAKPSQFLTISLFNQACQIELNQKLSGLYMTLSVNDSVIISNVICENLNRIVRDLYLGFLGDFVFLDNQSTDDPFYTGLGDRFSLIYLEPDELPAGVG